MTLEKLSMMLFLDYWNQFNEVKRHLSRSASELLKAMEETVKIVHKGSHHLSVHPLQTTMVTKCLSPLEQLLRYSEKKCAALATHDPAAVVQNASQAALPHELKNHIIQSLIDALEQEMSQITAAEAMQNPLKINALESVKKVLLEQQAPHLRKVKENEEREEDLSDADVEADDDVVISLKANGSVSTLHFQADREEDELLQVKTA